ncbi:MAG: Uma2 family endonuclease [Candidatus Poribacteria bacterium]|nr:Uma2 family endonuclease [Candidatus Poribacteria bacterium]
MAETKAPKIHSLPADGEVFYPESDGKPMAETDMHRDLMIDFIKMLEDYFRARPDVYVSGNLLLYYEEENPKRSVAPDVFVVLGTEKKLRRTYLLWEEGKGPDLVLELSSKNTYRADLNRKKGLYAQVLGVSEYFLYDPDHQYLQPPLQGYRLVAGAYVEIPSVENRLPSTVLGLELGFKRSGELGLYEPRAKSWLLTPDEQAESRRQAEARAEDAEARAQQEARAREQAEAELARLRAELEQLRRQQINES